eukprot:IDg5821t1
MATPAVQYAIILPTLKEYNDALWKFAVRIYATEQEFVTYLDEDIPAVPQGITNETHTKRKSQAVRVIALTLSDNMLLKLGKLIRNAQNLTIKKRETIDDYITRHLVLRQEMTRAKYPDIASDKTTVTFIIRELVARPSLTEYVPMLLAQRPDSIRSLNTIHPHPQAGPAYRPQYNRYERRYERQNYGRRGRGGMRACGRGARGRQREQDAINQERNFDYYLLDSTCNPSFNNIQLPSQSSHQSTVSMPDGTMEARRPMAQRVFGLVQDSLLLFLLSI